MTNTSEVPALEDPTRIESDDSAHSGKKAQTRVPKRTREGPQKQAQEKALHDRRMKTAIGFLDLPPEVRNMVYKYYAESLGNSLDVEP